MFSGAKLFQLKDRHGLPLEIAIDKLYQSDVKIDWISFVNEARRVNYSDEKILKIVNEFVLESFINKADKINIVETVKKLIV